MSGKNTTTTQSGRVPDEFSDPAESMLEEDGNKKSDLIKAAFRLYSKDSWGREFLDGYISGEFDSLQEYAVGRVEEEYNLGLRDDELEDLYFGIMSIMAGMENKSENQAVRGCQVFALLDDDLAEDAAEYLDKISEKGYFE
ncbi:hypothetical protein [Candidatus Nanohalobium constans]|uniref:Uncharacterized protein n=1 Tax=Candidatus Nanohalobium constans TaxID=2565781 RepID=A0A5Q0UHF0_9ARCH|nr:hypothetical protein [Candidatus Nanohalobium constans]QGA81014.1 hypothetical protein LC1Nh_1147 [Candidatus Nanohalobium constans]